MERIAEIVCGSLEDALNAEKAGADRIELNNAMYLHGLTPSFGTIKLVVEQCNIPVVVMVRPRPGGFYYNDYEFNTMLADIEYMMEYNIEGVVFGCLDENGNIDKEKNKQIMDILNKHNKDGIFHRAFDCVTDPYESIETLIDLGFKRVLTTGLKATAVEGVDLLAKLQQKYGDKIEILVGDGVMKPSDCNFLINKTNVHQFHSPSTTWRDDPTTISENVSFGFAEPPHEAAYNIVDYDETVEFVKAVKVSTEN